MAIFNSFLYVYQRVFSDNIHEDSMYINDSKDENWRFDLTLRKTIKDGIL